MTSKQNQTNSIRDTIRRLEQQVNQARSRRICSTEQPAVVPAWAKDEDSAQTPRLKARRKAPTDFSSDWRRRAG